MFALLQLIAYLWALVVVPLATLLGFAAVTWPGRLFALAALCAGLAPVVFGFTRPRWRRAATGLLVIAGTLYATLVLSAPPLRTTNRAQTLSPLHSGWAGRLSPTRVLPEQDQLALGFFLALPTDPLLTLPQVLQLRRLTADLYRELDADSDFRGLPTALPAMYASLWSADRASRDGFVYVPPSLDRRIPAPALIFLHGSGGNFKAYLWILSRVADATGSVVIAPNNGFGQWSSADTPAIVASALARTRQFVPLDESRLTVIGLSNGGLGVCQTLAARPAGWAAAVLISPVFDDDALGSLASTRLDGLPVAVYTGNDDDRVPLDYVQASADRLARAGAQVDFTAVAGANHFLFFSHRRLLGDQLIRWLAAHR